MCAGKEFQIGTLMLIVATFAILLLQELQCVITIRVSGAITSCVCPS